MFAQHSTRHSARLGCLLAALFVVTQMCAADRGSIVSYTDVNIQEPAQRAIIAFNGFEEILILQTDVVADRETKVVEFMPLPAKPKVSLASDGCFAALQDLLIKHNVRYSVRRSKGMSDSGDKDEPVKVVVSAQLGPHDVTVVELQNTSDFVPWVKRFFNENGLGQPVVTDELSQLVEDYFKRGFHFFAFDVVTLSPQKTTVRPLAYEFKTNHAYYPLKVTNLYGGSETIELFTILPRGLRLDNHFEHACFSAYRTLPIIRSSSVSNLALLDRTEMAQLHPSIPLLISGTTGILQATKIEGSPAPFDSDAWISWRCYGEKACVRYFYEALRQGDAKVLERLVKLPFGFDRERIITGWRDLRKVFAERLPIIGEADARVSNISIHEAMSYRFENDFDNNFVNQVLEGRGMIVDVVELTAGDNKILLFIEDRYGRYSVVGFSR